MSAIVNTATTIPMTFLDADGVGKTGLTVTATARLVGSTTTVSVTVTERTGGDYDAAFTPTSVGSWYLKGSTTIDGDAALWTETVQVVTAAQADPAAALAGAEVTVLSAVTTIDDRLTLVRGDDYLNADGRALSWTVASPSLVGATATLYLRSYAGATVLSKAMTISGTTVRVDITSTETATLTLGTPVYTYELIAVLSGGSTVTLAQGECWVAD